jgi:transcriptional regulator with XRE-family HTH domain
MQALHKQVGIRVRELREQRGLSQEALADICGLHRTYIGLIERGERSLSLEAVEAVARGLGIAVAELFSGIPVAVAPRQWKSNAGSTALADITAHLEAIKRILMEAKLTDAQRYEALYKASRKKPSS